MYVYVILCPFDKGKKRWKPRILRGFENLILRHIFLANLRAAKRQFEEGPPESIERKSL